MVRAVSATTTAWRYRGKSYFGTNGINIIDAIWVSDSLSGYPAGATSTTRFWRVRTLWPDYWALYVLYPISNSPRHLPSFANIDQWLTGARNIINGRGGLYNPGSGILVDLVTKNEVEMQTAIVQSQFLDVTDPAHWAYYYIYALYATGITKDTGMDYWPDDPDEGHVCIYYGAKYAIPLAVA
jgi:hypothetical protein